MMIDWEDKKPAEPLSLGERIAIGAFVILQLIALVAAAVWIMALLRNAL